METTIEIVGVNGESAVIAGPRAGDKGVYLAPDLGGLMDPEADVLSEAPANFPGGRYVSHRIQVRRVTFAVDVVNDGPGSASWRYRDSEWRKMWAFDQPTKILVTTQDGTRTLEAYLEHIEVDMTIDPNIQEVNRVIMTVVAYDPFWYADDDVYEVEVGSSPVTITVREANPTDQPVWPIWVVEAPGAVTLPDYSFKADALASRTVALPNLVAGEHTVVNTNPAERQLVSALDTPVWQRMNGRRFRNPIPAYTADAEFVISRTGTGTSKVQLRLRRPFSRPWGLL